MTPGDDDAELFASLAERLRDAHRRVAQLPVEADEKVRLTRRLLVVTDAAKHDLRRASTRLDALLADLEDRHLAGPDSDSGPSKPLRHRRF